MTSHWPTQMTSSTGSWPGSSIGGEPLKSQSSAARLACQSSAAELACQSSAAQLACQSSAALLSYQSSAAQQCYAINHLLHSTITCQSSVAQHSCTARLSIICCTARPSIALHVGFHENLSTCSKSASTILLIINGNVDKRKYVLVIRTWCSAAPCIRPQVTVTDEWMVHVQISSRRRSFSAVSGHRQKQHSRMTLGYDQPATRTCDLPLGGATYPL